MKNALFVLLATAFATTVSYRLPAHEQACFFTEARMPGEKIGFYFAVQEGGEFDVDYDVLDPLSRHILSGQGERQGYMD